MVVITFAFNIAGMAICWPTVTKSHMHVKFHLVRRATVTCALCGDIMRTITLNVSLSILQQVPQPQAHSNRTVNKFHIKSAAADNVKMNLLHQMWKKATVAPCLCKNLVTMANPSQKVHILQLDDKETVTVCVQTIQKTWAEGLIVILLTKCMHMINQHQEWICLSK